jgi:uncharacterized membrane-anchored protein YitT (DUF2179 family)
VTPRWWLRGRRPEDRSGRQRGRPRRLWRRRQVANPDDAARIAERVVDRAGDSRRRLGPGLSLQQLHRRRRHWRLDAARQGDGALSVWLPLVNAPFVAIGYRQMGRAFAIRSALAIGGLSVVLATMHFPDVTPDRLLTAVFGGFFIGAGIGLAVRGGAVLDGTEIAALLKQAQPPAQGRRRILAFNIVLFLVAMSLLGVEPALYSILTYIAAARTLDFVIYGLEQYTAITIVSAHSALIRERIVGDLKRGVTVYRGFGGLSGAEQEILLCVVTRLEIGKVKTIVRAIDPHAFVVSHPLADAEGGVGRGAPVH